MFIKEGKERYGKGCRGREAITNHEIEREAERTEQRKENRAKREDEAIRGSKKRWQ
ncbi:MAG: hypothetical protein MSK46_10265 [Bacteroidales bacterium]|nr:hypothetical protein [Bacteroidales bacterium]